MPFAITQIRSGQAKLFTAKDILELLGDRINDEVTIGGELYRLSSCQEVASGGGGSFIMDWISYQVPINTNGQTAFYNQDVIDDVESAFLTVNNILYQYGTDKDYHIEQDRIYWHGSFPIETTDRMVIRYPFILSI